MSLDNLGLYILYILVFPGFLFTAIVGLFLTWIDRKVTAVVQSRVGPPWYQPYADIGKLLGKKMLIPSGSRRAGFLAAPLLSLSGATLAALIVFQAILNPKGGFIGDVIVLIYLSALPPIALIIGGASSRSPFGAIGAGREMSMVMAYEAGFILAVTSVLIKVGSIQFSDIIAYQAVHGPIALTPSGFIAFVVALFCIQAKLGYLPFDISEAETELIGGPLAEYSGTGLALFKISLAMMFFQLPALLTLLFLAPTSSNPLSMITFVIKLMVIYLIIMLVKSTHARLRLDQALDLFWKKLAILALAGTFLAIVGW